MSASPSNELNKSSIDARDQLRQMATGFILSRALTLAAELKIADTLKDSEKTASEIATELNLHSDSLYRLLRFLSSHNIFSENSNHQFSLTPLSQIMVSDASNSVHAYLDMLADKPPWESVKNMLHTIKTGEPSFEYLHGEKFFDYMSNHPESNARFNAGMSCFSSPDDLNIVNAYDFGNNNTIVDVGGGKGNFLASILSKHVNTKGILYDQAEIVKEPVDIIRANTPERCEIMSGNFFESVPTGGDIYALKLILHDWNDEQVVKILQNCRTALPSHGKILVIEGIMLDGNQPDPHKQLDISMMLVFGGRERTQKEFDFLFKQADLNIHQIIPTPSRLSIIEAGKM